MHSAGPWTKTEVTTVWNGESTLCGSTRRRGSFGSEPNCRQSQYATAHSSRGLPKAGILKSFPNTLFSHFYFILFIIFFWINTRLNAIWNWKCCEKMNHRLWSINSFKIFYWQLLILSELTNQIISMPYQTSNMHSQTEIQANQFANSLRGFERAVGHCLHAVGPSQ